MLSIGVERDVGYDTKEFVQMPLGGISRHVCKVPDSFVRWLKSCSPWELKLTSLTIRTFSFAACFWVCVDDDYFLLLAGPGLVLGRASLKEFSMVWKNGKRVQSFFYRIQFGIIHWAKCAGFPFGAGTGNRARWGKCPTT